MHQWLAEKAKGVLILKCKLESSIKNDISSKFPQGDLCSF